ncbi:EscU/YscU/HrcU family type III secretion system export apparatus switch protein [Pseudemcibacter aquimaris]|uniref:EscU/YscU/HrcU family type III secretion system export apparatus switch protein n=1 Tax=Pseudemcibacter aquimaris TaxID=2857064 RepID=UPI0020130DBB|nr:EscU/YscU/HrcU family type III secretion system export apparatus switch protein [Pseudemcibacter aquimaris]MCC3860824.1 EscU/YscU/HrcU family type III secretion system export apparatus switch protein [Pseudemcibacter aquimaris]WDU59644.1 EscU/YscU/HrcU family type III secretion system export apparatus switch protein [Pseudemcibacter aquimaris]
MNDKLQNISKRQKAVALEQKDGRKDIPRITATGTGQNAEKILRLAFDNDVKVRKDEELVEILSNFDVDSIIPVEALNVVSEILCHVYNENINLEKSKHQELSSILQNNPDRGIKK